MRSQQEIINEMKQKILSMKSGTINSADVNKIVDAIKNIRLLINTPDRVRLQEPEWLRRLIPDYSSIDRVSEAVQDAVRKLEVISDKEMKWPNDPEHPIAVRLSDGDKFYDAITQVITAQQGGGGSSGQVIDIPKVTTSTGQRAVAVANVDGSSFTLTGEYNSTPPTLANGGTDSLQLDSSGNLLVNLAKLISGEDQTWQYLKVMQGPASYANISADSAVKSGAGRFFGFICNSTSSGTVAIYDSTAASGTKIHNTMTPSAGASYLFPFGVSFGTGLYFDITNTIDLTVFYI